MSPSITGNMTHGNIENQFGTFAWFFVSEFWAEGYVGLTYAPLSYCQVGLGVGIEQAKYPLRFGGSLWLGNGHWSVLSDGGSGFWHRVVANYHLSPLIGIGFMSEKFMGVGPRLELNLPKLPVEL